ncbi:MAG TPA: ribosome biogenesis GTPase Der [Clostridiales bacterium]|nr:ribosome biogenesis GTPase Der [Clostridiales bacterium]
MTKPLVAIVGKPNVGKSTFFNRISGQRISIVKDTPGVTRDRLYADAEWCGKKFTLVDTGGLELKSTDEMWRHIKKQAEIAIDTADVIIFFTDVKSGIGSDDEEVALKLKKSGKPVVLAVNKLDTYKPELLYEYYNLALGEPFGISAEHGTGIGDLLDEVVSHFPENDIDDEEAGLKIAVVGKPNAGKSSLCNKLLGIERTIVSDVAGTTRDAIDTPFTYNGKKYTLIDTAGIRKKKAVDEDIEYYSVLRALASIRRADVCVMMIDATDGLTEQDTKILGYIHEQGKPSVVCMNKWDLIEKDTYTVNKFEDSLKEGLKFMDYFKSVYISAKTGLRTEKILSLCETVYENAHKRVSTGRLNDMIIDAVRMNEPPSYKGKRLKIFYASQVDVAPPVFVFFVNDVTLLHFSYKRYLENEVRRAFGFEGTPIRIVVREQDKDE